MAIHPNGQKFGKSKLEVWTSNGVCDTTIWIKVPKNFYLTEYLLHKIRKFLILIFFKRKKLFRYLKLFKYLILHLSILELKNYLNML